MIIANNIQISIYKDDKEIKIDNNMFKNFVIYNKLVLMTYSFELVLIDNFSVSLSSSVFSAGDEYLIKIKFNKENKYREYRCFVYEKVFMDGLVKILFLPYFFIDLFLKKQNVVEYDNVNNVVEKILDKIKKYFNTVNFERSYNYNKRYFYLINMSYVSMIKYLMYFLKNEIMNYCFYINMDNELSLVSFKKILNKKEKIEFDSNSIKRFYTNDKKFELNIENGFGKKVYFFDWEKGKMENYIYDLSKINDKLKVNTLNKNKGSKDFKKIADDIKQIKLVNGATIGLEKYYYSKEENEMISEYDLTRANYFSLLFELEIYSIDNLNVLDIINFNIVEDENNNYGLNGRWLVLNVMAVYDINGISSRLLLTNNYYY